MTDEAVFNRPEFLRRLTKRHHPGDWIGGLRRLCGPLAEAEDDGIVDTRPPQYLVALWRPVKPELPFLERWPYKATLVEPDSAAAARELLADVPTGARLWLGGKHIDWAFVAEIVMVGERHLRPFHYRELQSFIRTERQATLAAISVHYSGDDEVFEQFSSTRPPLLDE
jgi:hypothetical protein